MADLDLSNQADGLVSNGEMRSGWLSFILFHYVQPILSLGFTRPLQQDDLPPLHPKDRSGTLSKSFGAFWREDIRNNEQASLWRAIIKFLGRPYFLIGLVKLYSDFIQFSPVLILGRLVEYVSDPNPQVWHGIIYVSALFFAGFTGSIAWNNYFFFVLRAGQHVRSVLVELVYEKSFRLSNEERRKYTSGEIVNFASVDAKRIGNFWQWVHVFWSSPLQLILALIGLFSILGPSALAGVGVMILVLPLTYWVQRKTGEYQDSMMKHKDSRVKLLNEALQAIRVIKFFAWEEKFADRIETLRAAEVKELLWIKFMGALTDLLWVLCPPIVNIISFLTFVLTGHELTIGVIFSSMLLFNILRWPLISLPWVISDGVQARVSVNRIQEFLLSEELEEFQISTSNHQASQRSKKVAQPKSSAISSDAALVQLDEEPDAELSIPSTVAEDSAVARIGAALAGSSAIAVATAHSSGSEPVVRISNGTFSWTKSAEKPDLRNINLTALQGQLVVIIGHVGSGKSSVLSALLGEMRTVEGSYNMLGSCAYAAQQPWIMHDTVKNNITMGLDYDAQKYQSVVECCALVRDLEILPGGSSCEIGEKGVSLSGGQKARVALARAVYRDAEVYLLDDIFAAVDVHVARHIFEEAVLKTLNGKTRILVTHHYFTLPKADLVIYMKNGEVAAAGTFQQLQTQGISLLELMTDEKGKEAADGEENTSEDVSPTSPSLETKSAAKLDDNEKEGKSVNEEERETGQLKGSVMKDYIVMCGILMTSLVILFTFGDQGTSMFRDWFLSNWARSHETHSPTSLAPVPPPESTFVVVNDPAPTMAPTTSAPQSSIDMAEVKSAMLIYCMLALGAALIRITEEVLLIIGTLRASKLIHDRTLSSVFRAPIQFFDTTPIGRILNRFSKDQDSVDNEIAPQLQDFLTCAVQVLGSIVFLLIAAPVMIILLIPIAIGYYWVTEYFRRSSREIQRLQSISASPIFSHFSETLNGVSTLRAFKLEKRFSSMILDKIDSNNQSQVMLLQINRWLSVRLAWIAVTVTVFTALSGVVGKALGISNPVIFGLAMTYAIPLVENLNWMVRCFTGTETNMTSVERLVQYQKIQREAARVRPGIDPRRGGADSWPRNGRIEFREFQMRYRDDLPPVLKGINCTINAGEKIGICGRTGAGKSSILLALFRLVEASGGSIWIDGIDISTIGLARLRSSLSIIPQDPVLFTGTVRSNLDPFDEYTDDELWTVLRRCSMANKISELPSKLDTEVSENGSNFSVGERQLLCLARALCHKSRIILLDEATAAVDFETDKLIQETVRKEFTESTVLTIAHRINTIMDYDRIIVLEQGQVVEQGSPSQLVSNPETHFAQMVAGGA